jgi:hypothetical protein
LGDELARPNLTQRLLVGQSRERLMVCRDLDMRLIGIFKNRKERDKFRTPADSDV